MSVCARCKNGDHRCHWFSDQCGAPLGKDPIETALKSLYCKCDKKPRDNRRKK